MRTEGHVAYLAEYDGIAPWMTIIGGVLLFLATLHLLGLWVARRRMMALADAFQSTTRGAIAIVQVQRALVSSIVLQRAPSPFTTFEVDFDMGFSLPTRAIWALITRFQLLTITATLNARPHCDLVWQLGGVADKALGRAEETELWRKRTLSDGAGEYAVRGPNTAALEHAFLDLQSRFGPYLKAVDVSLDLPNVTVILLARRLNTDDIPALVTATRALGRGALAG